MIDKERQTIIYEWLRNIGYTASSRAVNKLVDKLKVSPSARLRINGKPPVLSDEEIQCLKGRCMLPCTEYDRQVAKAQRDADVRFYND